MVCKFCGKEFEGRKKKYCSVECRNAYGNAEYMKKYRKKNPEKPYKERICGYCGEKFVTNKYQQIYCSESCSGKNKYYTYNKPKRKERGYEIKSITYTCKQCGKEYHPKVSKERDVFCSRECHQEFMHSNAKPKVFEPKFTYMKYCETCGGYFETRKIENRICKQCSYEKQKNKTIEKYKIEAKERYLEKVKEIECVVCGKKFIPKLRRGWQISKCCSKECSDINKKSNSKRRIEKYKNNGSVDNDITLDKLIKRDKNICHICGGVCDFNHFIRDGNVFIVLDKYPSIDHVHPISKGGTHTWNNIKLAHHRCNTLKSDKVV